MALAALLLLGGGCLPPPIDDPEALVAGLLYFPEQLKPASDVIVMRRDTPGQVVTFDVREAFRDPEGGQLTYYWYMSWDVQSPTAPVVVDTVGTLTFVPCTDLDVTVDGVRPATHRVMVVASNEPLEDETMAMLGAPDEARVAKVWWLIDFQGTVCP